MDDVIPQKKNNFRRRRYAHMHPADVTDEDHLFADTVFDGVDRNVVSKDFKGERVTCVFGGLKSIYTMQTYRAPFYSI
jgi:hypothetical protein